ncbi:MAG: hypothetical protein A2W35_16390 [Chloroflexi bacterium RBG_16_57_11]|nr:MAG: hypothetical protein A2W35_16390 [Chloroflexi bacterium RBG_16_57_11]
MFTNNIDPDNPLTPSEVVFLNGEQFAENVKLGNVDLIHSDEKVSLAQLGGTILATAILACEQAGAFRLEVRERKATLGLRKVRELFAAPAQHRENLPEGSLEATYAGMATQMALKEKNDIYTILYTWLHKDSISPWTTALELLKAGMAKRGLLEATEEKKLKLFKVTRYSLPERTARLVKGQSVGPVKALLDTCQRTRPEVWKELEAGIKKAIAARTEASHTDLD